MTTLGVVGWILAVIGLILAIIALISGPTLLLVTWGLLATSLGVGLIHLPFG